MPITFNARAAGRIPSGLPMFKVMDRLRSDFQGSADALILKAQELAKTLQLHQEGNERLLRHYVSMGVVDKPSREGRDALYGFRHLVQFVAARRLLAEGYSLTKIAGFTSAVTTDILTAYLEKPGPTSEAELLVAAFRSEHTDSNATARVAGRSPPPRPMHSRATGMGMVDVMHEMREMEERVHDQITRLQRQVHAMVDDAIRDVGSQLQAQHADPLALKQAVGSLAKLMDDATRRFDHMLQKPLQMIEKQMDQQRYLFEEAYKQKDMLEQIFGRLFNKQQHDVRGFLEEQTKGFGEMLALQRRFQQDLGSQLDRFHSEVNARLATLESRLDTLQDLPPPTPQTKEGAA